MTSAQELGSLLDSASALSSELLEVFQQERTFCLAKGEFDLEEVKNFVGRKERLTGKFDSVRRRIRGLIAAGVELSAEHRSSLRRLGITLERLLIIDCENEKQLRELAAGVRAAPQKIPEAVCVSEPEPESFEAAAATDSAVEAEAAAAAPADNDDEISRLVDLLVGKV